MKLFTLLLSLTLSFSIFASTSRLENLIDEHQYFLTVEWDQKDKAVFEGKSREFGRKFNDIVTNEVITKKEIMDVFQSHVMDPKAAARLNVRLALLPAQPSAEAIKALFEDTKKDLYARGASWNGEIDWEAVGWIVGIVVIIAAAAWYGASQSADGYSYCKTDPTLYGCKDYKSPGTYVCTSWGTEWRCTTTTSTDYAGNSRSEQVCGNYQACMGGYYKKDE